jgi:peptide deformylase
VRLKIVQAGEAVLRQQAHPLSPDQILNSQTQQLIEWMRDTMRDAPGVGLAAPQVGLGLQLAVVEDRSEYTKDIPPDKLQERSRRPVPFHVLINPRIVSQSADQAEFFEGCLSLAGFGAFVRRSTAVTVEYLDEHAEFKSVEAKGWYARILQHEIDHLQGRLYVDRMEPRSFMTTDNFNRYWKDLPLSLIRNGLALES